MPGAHSNRASGITFPPSPVQVVFDGEDVQHLPYEVVCEPLYIPGTMVEARGSGEDDGPRLGNSEHVLQVNGRERSLSGDKDKRAALLEGAVCRTEEEVVGKTAGDPGQRLHAAGDHDHSRM